MPRVEKWVAGPDGPVLESVTDERTVEEARAERKGFLAERRWEVETGGCTWNGWPVQTDRESRGTLHAEYTAAKDGTRIDGDLFKFADGVFRPLANAEMIALVLATRAFVRSCYAKEAQVAGQIDDPALSSNDAVDAIGWNGVWPAEALSP